MLIYFRVVVVDEVRLCKQYPASVALRRMLLTCFTPLTGKTREASACVVISHISAVAVETWTGILTPRRIYGTKHVKMQTIPTQ